jgi:glutamyl-tRNA synthetase
MMRTAIYNWLFARGRGGTFIVRIEDTDQGRLVEGSVDEMLESLRWLGIEWDEGPDIGGPNAPYHQSQRLDDYHRVADLLIERGAAYRGDCRPERLEAARKERGGSDGKCGDAAESGDSGSSVVRFAMPTKGTTVLDDLIRGRVEFENGLVDDFVLLKSDGFPTYHLASIVDDRSMGITHVFRGEEWLPSVPRHLQIYRALGWEPPQFVHLPQILAPDRSKLSKRHGAVSVREYREMGYLPEAMVNFLALLGWSLDDKTEVMSTGELKQAFSLERVSRSGAMFDTKKLEWMNGHYIRGMDPGDLADALLDYWRTFPGEGVDPLPDRDLVERIVPLVRERLKTLRDAAPLIGFFFQDGVEYDPAELVQRKMDEASTKQALSRSHDALAALDSFDEDSIEAALRELAGELDLKVGQLLGSIRVATTGLKVAPPLFGTLEILGRERSLDAIAEAAGRL